MRNVVAPVNSSPAHSARCTGAAPRQAGSSEKCRFTQPCGRDVERGLRQQRAVGDHRAAVRRAASRSASWKSGSRGCSGLSTGTPSSSASCATGEGTSLRPRPARASGRVTTPTSSCGLAASARSDGSATSGVPAKTTRIEAAAVRTPSPRVGCGLTLMVGGAPNHSDSRIAFIASLRVSASSRSTNRMPSRWSVSCWIARASGLGALDGDRLAVHVEAARDDVSARGQSKTRPGIDRQPSSPSWVSSDSEQVAG